MGKHGDNSKPADSKGDGHKGGGKHEPKPAK